MGANCILGLTAPQEKTKHSRTHKHIHTRNRRVGGRVLSWSLWPMLKGVPPLVVVMVTAADWGGHKSSLRQTPIQADWCTVTVFDVAVVEAVAGQRGAGGGDAAVLQQVETWGGGDGGGGARAGGRVPLGERLHGGEDQSQAVSHVLVGSAGQSWGVA